jgi:hypothetical protein
VVLVQWPQTGALDQYWTLREAEKGGLNIVNVKSQMCISVQDGSKARGAPLVQWPCHEGVDQAWSTVELGEDVDRIDNVTTGLSIAVRDASTQAGAVIVQWNYDGNPSQKWTLERTRTVPQQYTITEMLLKAAAANPLLMSNLVSDPATVFAGAGYPLQIEDFREFERFFQSHRPTLEALARGARPEEVADWTCIVCQISLWTIGAGIVGIGAAGLALLTTTNPLVIGLVAVSGASAPEALAFIIGLGALAEFTVSNVLTSMCGWLHLCR